MVERAIYPVFKAGVFRAMSWFCGGGGGCFLA